MSLFTNKHVLITGAASGLGKAVALALAAEGAVLTVVDVQREAGAALADQTGGKFVACDVGDEADWLALIGQLQNSGTPALDYLHLNAGIQIAPPSASLSEYTFAAATTERYRRLLSVNVDGVVFGLKHCMQLMPPGSAVVVTSSLAGVTPYAVDPLYAMTKHAVSGLVRSVAEELASAGLRINALCPGGLDTAIIPHEQRNPAALMRASAVAEEVLKLFATAETGHTWAKVAADRPAWVIHPPGVKERPRLSTADIDYQT